MTEHRLVHRLAAQAMSILALAVCHPGHAVAEGAPVPLVEQGRPVDWWFVFKFNSASFPYCAPTPENMKARRSCPFGGQLKVYNGHSQRYVVASSDRETLEEGNGCLGASTLDPVGLTFEQVYNGDYNYVIWNDQFYRDPPLQACGKSNSCGAPWGHAKGLLAWNDDGDGFVMQVTTPSWPAAGSKRFRRKTDGNTLGCIKNNNIKFSQHFFAVKLNKDGVVKVLRALDNASVVTDPAEPQIVRNGGPREIRALVDQLGRKPVRRKEIAEKDKYRLKPESDGLTRDDLSRDVILISKPSGLHVPPWQLVSAAVDGAPLRAATWWARPKIYSTGNRSNIRCWPAGNVGVGKPGPVQIATTGEWMEAGKDRPKEINLVGGANHAKVGVSTKGETGYAIFGDMNQQGAIGPLASCNSSQNGRGGLFFVLKNDALFTSLGKLIDGESAPMKAPSN